MRTSRTMGTFLIAVGLPLVAGGATSSMAGQGRSSAEMAGALGGIGLRARAAADGRDALAA